MSVDLTLVPPQRLGALLSSARQSKDLSLVDISRGSNGLWSPTALADVERGTRTLSDDEVRLVTSLYDVETSPILPKRCVLELDLTTGRIGIGETAMEVRSREVDEVLERYLSLLYLIRNIKPGKDLTLRDRDLAVLSETLEQTLADLERRLGELMIGTSVQERTRLLSRRIAVPAAGLLVAVTAVGSLVMVRQFRPPAPKLVTGNSTQPAPLIVSSASGSLPAPGDGFVQNASGLIVTTPAASLESAESPSVEPAAELTPITSAPLTIATPVPVAEATDTTTTIDPRPPAQDTLVPLPVAPDTGPIDPAVDADGPAPAELAAPAAPAAPAQSSYAALGAAAESLIPYDFRTTLAGWTIDYEGDSAGYRGLTNTQTRTIAIYVNPGDTATDVAGILAHEVAHAIDVQYLTAGQREQWLNARAMPLQWWPGSGLSDFHVGAGDFAEAVAAYLVGSPSDSAQGGFTSEQLQLAASFLP